MSIKINCCRIGIWLSEFPQKGSTNEFSTGGMVGRNELCDDGFPCKGKRGN